MLNNLLPKIEIRSSDVVTSKYEVKPNFLLLNKPLAKGKTEKSKRVSRKLVVWLTHENKELSQVTLKDMTWQLVGLDNDGVHTQLKPINLKTKNDVVELDNYTMYFDSEGQIISPNNCFIYEIDTDDVFSFKYTLTYTNDDKAGIVGQNTNTGGSQGTIRIDASNKDKYIFNNAVLYSEKKASILKQQKLVINTNELKLVNPIKDKIASAYLENEEEESLIVSKSDKLRAELSTNNQFGINYLSVDDKTLKIAQNDDKWDIYLDKGNKLNWKDGKLTENDDSKVHRLDKDKLTIKFQYNHQDIEVDWKINKPQIKLSNKPQKDLFEYATYKNIKPNSLFEAVKAARKLS